MRRRLESGCNPHGCLELREKRKEPDEKEEDEQEVLRTKRIVMRTARRQNYTNEYEREEYKG